MSESLKMYFYVTHVKCPGCQKLQSFKDNDGRGLRLTYNPEANYKLLLSCSAACAQKFSRSIDGEESDKSDINFIPSTDDKDFIITSRGPIAYRKITQTLDK